MKNLYLIILPIMFLGVVGCEKEAGEGGTSTITGKVWAYDLNGSGEVRGEYDAMDHDVYIIYGNEDKTYDDKFATSLDGSYTFTNLTIGSYTVFTYSDCDECASGTEVIERTVEITEKDQVVEVETMEINE